MANPKRHGKNCHKDISHKHPNAKFCKDRCRFRYHNRTNPRGFGVVSEQDQMAIDSFDPGWDGHKDSF